jgi:hypothetical protein
MTETLSSLPESGPVVRCCDACTCSTPHRSEPVEPDNTPEVNVQES